MLGAKSCASYSLPIVRLQSQLTTRVSGLCGSSVLENLPRAIMAIMLTAVCINWFLASFDMGVTIWFCVCQVVVLDM